MKKNYVTPEVLFALLEAEDVCTISVGVLEQNEFENEEQWWMQ